MIDNDRWESAELSPRIQAERPRPWAALSGIWQRNQDLLRNAGSLAASTGLTSVFGFVFWILAAHEFSQSAVGLGAAAISAMMLLGTIGMFGLGTVLIGELPKSRSGAGLIVAALFASGLGSLILGLGFPLIAEAFGGHFPAISGTLGRLALFAFGVAITGASLVFDDASIGLMRGGMQLTRNLAMSVIKLAILPAVAILLHDAFGVGIIFAWVLGTLASVVPVVIMIKRSGSKVLHRPDWGVLRGLGKTALAHNWLNLAIATPPKLIPVIVTVVVSPSANGAFYVAWMLANFLFMVPTHLSTVLFAIASAAPEMIAEKLRFVLRLSLAIGLPVMVVLALGAHLALYIFGAKYANLATVPLWLLIAGYIPWLPKAQYIAVCRATGQVTKAAIVLSIATICELVAVLIGGKVGGLNGLTFALLAVWVLEGLYTAPAVIRTAYNRGRLRQVNALDTSVSPSTIGATGPIPITTGDLNRQQAGLAALLALATAAVSEVHSPDTATEIWRAGKGSLILTSPDLRRHRRADTQSTRPSAVNATGPIPARLDYRRRQQAGLDALIALATPVVSDEHTLDTQSGK
jgi:O-antigen/teichoic acid export membrane protein